MKTKEEFITFFQAIPAENFIKNRLIDPDNPNLRCALGHCGMVFYPCRHPDHFTPMARDLAALFPPSESQWVRETYGLSTDLLRRFTQVVTINNTAGDTKENIINALRNL